MKHPLRVDLSVGVRRLRSAIVVTALASLLPSFVAAAAAQPPMVMPPTEQLSFTRPESWALALFTSATLLSGLETPVAHKPGDLSVGVELGWLPTLSPAQRRVGYNGMEEQDLNKAPFIPRLRASIGLPFRLSLIVGGTPPVSMFGLKATLIAIGLERPVIEAKHWTVGLRGYGQRGTVRGAYTCPSSVLAFAPGSPNNDSGCQALSSDKATLGYVGGEISVTYRPDASSRFSPHVAVGLNHMNVGFNVDALTFGYVDHTSYVSRGTTVSASGGASCKLTSRLTAAIDVFYTPLQVHRSAGAPLVTDGFFNVRAILVYRLK